MPPVDRVQELRVRIDALSSKITVQMELLKHLEHEKSLAQRELNAVLDPVARLPPEISSEIFLQCLPSRTPMPSAYAVPVLLLDVCNAWTDIALATPALWAAICVVCPCVEGFEEGLQTWLQRASSRPLSMLLRGNFYNADVPALIRDYGKQLRHLELCEERGFDEDEDEDSSDDSDDDLKVIDLFGARSPGPLPLLEALTIRCSSINPGQFSGHQILDLLGLACNLIECTFQDLSQDIIEETTATTVVPSLRHFAFGKRTDYPRRNDAAILKFLTLPALQTLRLDSVSGDDFLSFLRRSSPPLNELSIDVPRGSTFIECLKLMPTLQQRVYHGHRSLGRIAHHIGQLAVHISRVTHLQDRLLTSSWWS
ncbi:hypothetical protein DFH06DRAFT_1464142 [Mycena polygramma]|nr:hypothetical protein DFH06DRAFT_1464142 [Mycena polygramma]